MQIVIGCLLMIATVIVHSGCTVAAIWAFRSTQGVRWGILSGPMKVAALVLLLFLAALLEIWIWAVAYLSLGALTGMESALYFSAVTFTTLGYGDVVLDSSWRLLASFEAVNGIIMFGWSTALLVALVHRVFVHQGSPVDQDKS
jgi:hypothetical protein